jgi:putative MATE family efflux protein
MIAAGQEVNISTDRAGARRLLLLNGPILSTMLRLAFPTVAVLFVQTLVSVAETYFVSVLGTDAVAGVALVFPLLLLMTTMSNGGVGGGVSSAVARALGAGRNEEAERLVLHGLVIGIGCGLLFTLGAYLGGPVIYRALGGSGRSLELALLYSGFIFAGAVPIWSVNMLTSALRGAGNVKVPALIVLGGAVVVLPLSPVLIYGLGHFPALGVAGAGVAVVFYYLLALWVLIAYLRRSLGGLRIAWAPLEWRYAADILRVGGLSSLGTVQGNLTIVLVTGAVGRFGTDALAGYGLASRLDSLLIPILFGLGTAVLTLVGINVGAGQVTRARRIAWTGAFVATLFAETVGLSAALAPRGWLGLFSSDPRVIAAGSLYLREVAPFYGFFGAGLLLYFAGQGAGRVSGPFMAGSVRLLVAAGFGWVAVTHFGVGLSGLFGLVAFSSFLFGSITAVVTRIQTWQGAKIP